MKDELRIFLCAGEASGDRYAAKLAERLRALSPGVRLSGVGGERMAAAGVTCHIDLAKHATMGFLDVIRKVGTFARLLRQTDNLLARDQPDAVVLIDNPGFNLRVAAAAKRRGIPVIYYVSPQVWAWYRSRIKKIARLVDKMLVILPFETDLYKSYGVDCEYVGHPMLDYMSEARLDPVTLRELGENGDRHQFRGSGADKVSSGKSETGACPHFPLVGLLPGSRDKEVERVFPLIAQAAARLAREAHGVRFAVACAKEEHTGPVKKIMDAAGIEGTIYHNRTFEVMKAARMCIAVSGTATLELCYFGTPMVVLYRAPAAARMFKWLIKTPHICLVNIIAGREIVPEFMIFGDRDPVAPAAAAAELLMNDARHDRCVADLSAVMRQLGGPGASDRAAKAILEQCEK